MGSICLVSTVVTFILAKTENDLKQRGRYLVLWNGLSATGVVTVYLMLNAFVGNFPCFILLWTAYLCIVPWLLTYLARGWRLVYIYNQQVDFGNINVQRNSVIDLHDPAGMLALPDRDAGAGATMASDKREDLGRLQTDQIPRAIDVTGSTSATPVTSPPVALTTPLQPSRAELFRDGSSMSASAIPTFLRAPKTYLNSVAPLGIYPFTHGGNVVEGDGTHSMVFEAPQNEEKQRWSRYLPFNKATDSRLTVFLLGCMVFPFLLCLGMQFIKPSPVQINPTSYKCGEGPVFYPVYAIILGFLAIGCPLLTWKLWWIKDGFGIRNELLVTMMIGIPGFILYFISPYYLKRLDTGHWNHVNWLTLTIFLGHVNSVVLPLIQFFRRQRPKKRGGSSARSSNGNPFTSIFRWDSPKTELDVSAFEIGSDLSSNRYYSRSSSQVMSIGQQSEVDPYDPSLYDGDLSPESHISDQFSIRDGKDNPSVPANLSTVTGQRLRGIKGFWSRYGKDAEGNIISLARMDPRAFAYAIQDAEMLSELVKFSVTVFSAENTKFLQEYDGLRKQVREYYRLAGYGHTSNRNPKHARTTSDGGQSVLLSPSLAEAQGPQSTVRSQRNMASLFSNLSPTVLSKHSAHGSAAGSDWYSNDGSAAGSIKESHSDIVDSNPGTGTATQPSAPTPIRPAGKHRQDSKESLWKMSLQSPLRHSNPTPGHDAQSDGGPRSRSAPSPLTSQQTQSERQHHDHQHKASLGGRTFRSEGVTDDSESSSFSWYGRGNTGSTTSYQDVTPNESDSYQDTASNGIRVHSQYFSSEFDPVAEYGGNDVRDVTILDPLSGEELSARHLRSIGGTATSIGAPNLTGVNPGYTGDTSENQPSGSSSGGRATLQQRQLARLGQPLGISVAGGSTPSPFHSPSSSVSATFTPRLPSQPQVYSSNTIRPIAPSFTRSTSGKSILTAEEHRQQFQSATVPAGSGLPLEQQHVSWPSSSASAQQPQQQQQQHELQVVQPLTESVPRSPSHAPSSVPRSRRDMGHSDNSTTRPSRPNPPSSPLPYAHNGGGGGASANRQALHRRTPVPRALLPAYWEICHTFILPNATLELNLNQVVAHEIRRLFMLSNCYLEMYAPVVREVQELVYANVWPRFVYSLQQRQPQGFSEKVRKSWKSIFGRGDNSVDVHAEATAAGELGGASSSGAGVNDAYAYGQDHSSGQVAEEIYMMPSNGLGIRGKWSRESGKRRSQVQEEGSTSRDYLNQPQGANWRESQDTSPSLLSYIHGQYGDAPAGILGDHSHGNEKNGGEEMEMDVGRYGVMQDLDLSAFKRIPVDPK
ncbi:hypothetical protein BGZ99_005604 [Dissophora globulifera]|uniref:RGS domain-containing protein n=1 Tax=Dissophora globulifera TaxID=979702 RepID=A0A9P6REP1_9FUNG|nr:hypothetical protein BGZ99_005604 [Dissophora globulifera]